MPKEELNINTSVTIGVTNVEVSKECFQQRSAIVLTNTSTGGQIISIAIGEQATANLGIQLRPGGVYQDTRDGNYNPSNKQINAISDVAGGTLAVHERILMDTRQGW